LMSACTPAPPPESEPAMVMAMVSMRETMAQADNKCYRYIDT
jgi:hypothetical protein